jgi:hypothetical protein
MSDPTGDGERFLSIDADVSLVLSWCYDSPGGRLAALYENAKQAQWNATTDIDWALPVPFGAPLPFGSRPARASFEASPLAERGEPAWDAFRWQVQAWMVCQFLHGEQAAMVASARLAEALPDIPAKLYAISQAGDEARHLEAFARYVREHVSEPYPISPALRQLFEDGLRASEWDLTALAIQCLLEPVALAGFRMAEATFHDGLIKQIVGKVARDEARHVSYGILLLKDRIPALGRAERRSREDYVLECMALMRRRFLLADIWQRLDVDEAAGSAFALTDPGLVTYRRAMFSRVIPLLAQIGMLTPRVVTGLEQLDLLDLAGWRTVERVRSGEPLTQAPVRS